MEDIKNIILKRGKEESLMRFHPWVFSGAIHSCDGDPQEGELVNVLDGSGNFIARGHFQNSSIAVRVLTFAEENIDGEWWRRKFMGAYGLRKAIGLTDNPNTACYRLIHGEGDGLPGLIVDIYNDTAVIQTHSAGMYANIRTISEGIVKLYDGKITAVYDKSTGTLPYKSGIQQADGYIFGSRQSDIIVENGNKFTVNWEHGQKTGFFIDQRDNRELVGKYAAGRTVLNTFCYTGGFSVYALRGGASHVDSVDSSARAVELVDKNVKLNFGENVPHEAITADAFEFIKRMDKGYDMIILDPPAFAKHHKVLGNALQGYKRLNTTAFTKINKGGILFTFSCSQAVSREQFRNTVFSAAVISGRKVRILHQLTQPADHPVNIYHPEGEYLKGLVLYVE
ncbi:MAG: class I SAM-dependent rRNA methyltransferase [Rikenellaceae bacterium]|nr:class I SAM-dependent rRNA methyltransferase [Rikenellaceae bacterium]